MHNSEGRGEKGDAGRQSGRPAGRRTRDAAHQDGKAVATSQDPRHVSREGGSCPRMLRRRRLALGTALSRHALAPGSIQFQYTCNGAIDWVSFHSLTRMAHVWAPQSPSRVPANNGRFLRWLDAQPPMRYSVFADEPCA